MNGKLSDNANWVLAIIIVIAIVVGSLGIGFFVVLNGSPLLLHVPVNWHGYQANQVMADYCRVIRYLQCWPRQLHVYELPISGSALKHFADVKSLVKWLQVLTVFSLLICWLGLRYEKKNYQLWRLVILLQQVLLLLGVMVGMLCLSFNDSFIIMHHLLFRNNYWVFSSKTDPIILLLPVSFFAKLFVVWMIIAAIILLGCWYWIKKCLN